MNQATPSRPDAWSGGDVTARREIVPGVDRRWGLVKVDSLRVWSRCGLSAWKCAENQEGPAHDCACLRGEPAVTRHNVVACASPTARQIRARRALPHGNLASHVRTMRHAYVPWYHATYHALLHRLRRRAPQIFPLVGSGGVGPGQLGVGAGACHSVTEWVRANSRQANPRTTERTA